MHQLAFLGGLLIGAIIGVVVVLLARANRVEFLRLEMAALINAVVQPTEHERSRRIQLAIDRAWEVLRR